VPSRDGNEESASHNQAGRSSSSLEAERNSADLQSLSANSKSIIRISTESLQQSSSANASTTATHAPASNRRTSYVPAIPSPLNPASPTSSAASISSQDEIVAAEGGNVSPIESSNSSDGRRSQRQVGRKSSSSLSPPQVILRQKSASILRPPTPERPQTPKRLHDLGRDYSRYPSSQDVRSESRPPALKSRISVTTASLLRTTTTNPFNDSQADLEKFGYPDDSIAAFHPYHGGEKGFILYADEIEADDTMHMPRADDDIVYKPKLSDYFSRKQIFSTIGVTLLILGLACVFVVLPVLTFSIGLGGNSRNT
jgi:hypothetical protein